MLDDCKDSNYDYKHYEGGGDIYNNDDNDKVIYHNYHVEDKIIAEMGSGEVEPSTRNGGLHRWIS